MCKRTPIASIVLIALVASLCPAAVDKWVTVTGEAAGTSLKVKDEAVQHALRKAVEESCGVFLTAQSKTRDYKTIYDKVLSNTVGYVIEHKVLSIKDDGEITRANCRVHVSTKKFEEAWATIAHTINQENNPRVIIAIVEATRYNAEGPVFEVKEGGVVQSMIEDFFLKKGVKLMDKGTTSKLTKRDVLLATIKDDTKAVAALGARFDADVVVTGRASAKYGSTIKVSGFDMHKYSSSLTLRAVRTDSAEVLAVKSYGPSTSNTLQRAGGEDKALSKLAEEAAPKILAAVVEGWRKQVNVSRTLQLSISGMSYKSWKVFKAETEKLRGVQALRLREITEDVASIDVEYDFDNAHFADAVTELENTKLEVTEITANRIKLKVPESE
jgi:hypothetical protein